MQFDIIKKPEHYNWHPSGVENIEISRNLPFALGNVFKYCFRKNHKNGVEDLKKVLRYIDFMDVNTYHMAVLSVKGDVEWSRKLTTIMAFPDPGNPILDKMIDVLNDVRYNYYDDYLEDLFKLVDLIKEEIQKEDGYGLNPYLLN